MADLSNDIRLAVDSGVTALGLNEVIRSIRDAKAKLIVVASRNKESTMQDIAHMAKVANVPMEVFEGNPIELGAVCGKPFSVSAVSVIEAGNSNILKKDKQ
ncbi:50S ribosomal protein L30e [mine drainage metagenome]|jgi:large subunit ribosomal protein L30e|uniref:50S ribosomal protein L30e n=1 Tax=mine drainage metagenome TaxID=410659 RepID=T1APY2_9ZZZZ|nr:50S ribosomal protein L30e [Candidatus Marsarchaeota archaeon]